TRCTWIGIGIHSIGTLIEWRMGRVRSRMRWRRVNPKLCWPSRSEEHSGKQPTALHTAGLVTAAHLKPTKRHKEAVGRKIQVSTEYATRALPEIGNDHDIGLVIAGARFDPCL